MNTKTTTSFNINWTNGDGANRILIARANEPVNTEPQDLESYSSNSSGYGSSYYEIGTGNYVLYAGSGNSDNVTNLEPGTNYHFALFEYNGNSGKSYLRPAYTFEAETFGATPTTQVSNINFANIGATSMHVNFTRGNGSSRLVIAKKGAAVDVQPSDNTNYSADAIFGDGQEIGSDNFVVYNGTDEEFQLSNLDETSEYHFAFFEYAINDNDELYLIPGATASQATPAPPTVIPNDFSYTRPCDSDLVLSWTSGNGQGRLVILSEVPLNATPTNSTNYTANFGYGMGDAIGNGYVVYNAAGNLVPPNLLQASTDYYVNIYEYNGTKIDPIFNMMPLEGFIGDITAPSAVCQDIQIVLDAVGNATITAEDIGTIPTGDCGTVTGEIDIDSLDCSNLGSNTVTLTLTDSDGNTSSCTSSVTVVDETAPNVITKDISVQLDLDGTVTIAEDAVNDGSTDACGSLIFATDMTTFNSGDLGENTVTLTVTDGSGNFDSATAVVTVLDIAAPANDDLCDAIFLNVGTISAGNNFTNVGATAQANEINGSCWSGIGNPQTVWFSFESPSSGNVTLSTDIAGGTLNDTHITIYEAPADCSDLSSLGNEIACNEDEGTSVKAVASMTGLTVGNMYYVQIDGNGAQTGTFGVQITDEGCLNPSGVSVDVVADTSANISWIAGGSENNWIVKYSDIAGFDPETEGSSEAVDSSPNTQLNGLNPNTAYEIYVKADCGSGAESDLVGPVEFTTGCLGSPSLSFLGTGAYQTSIISPAQGTPETTYEFKIVYTNEAGVLPPYGFPRVLLDYEGNGSFTNNNDRAVILSAEDPNDTNTIDGKIYYGSISQLPSGSNWQAWVQVQASGCTTEIGPFDAPDVLIAPDLEIFANDIVFDNPNPEVSSALQITASIHNNSDLPAENFVAHLKNQFDTNAVYPDITIDYLGPQESTNVVWNITTPAIESWNPMEVFIDYTDVIAESNELNNRALRPFTNGDFNLPGAINVQATVSPSVVQLPSGTDKVFISGHAYYTDTAVVLQDSTVAGATVSFVNPITGNQVQTHTNANGYFSFKTYHGSQPGPYTAIVEVTDYTLTGETPVNWELIQGPCVTNLRAKITPSYKSILEGESVSADIVVSNIGCEAVTVETLLEINQTGGLPLIGNMTIPPLEPGESYIHNFTAQFDTVGTYYITGHADANNVVQESSENNNLGNMTIKVNPPFPDIIPAGSGSLGSQYLCNASGSQSFGIRNIGHVPTGEFKNIIEVYFEGSLEETYTETVQNINPGQSAYVSIPFEYQQTGNYSFVLTCDVPDLPDYPIDRVTEISETNNIGNYSINIFECRPDLKVSSCDLVVNPVDLQVPGTVNYTAQVRNGGNGIALAPVEFEFTLSNGEVYPLIHNQDILPGEMVSFTTSAAAVNSGIATLTATVDPNNLIDDNNLNNNSSTEELCWEFEPVSRCGYDFWNGTYHENESAQLAVGVRVKHLYQASEVKVRFEVTGPGITGWALLGDAAVQNVSNCNGCPYSAVLPTPFVFNQTGVYTFRMTSDPDNEYQECNEGNNVLIKEVTVANKPDMRIESEYINPTLLNPDPGQSIFFHVSYENIGYSNINDEMDLKLIINNDEHAIVNNVTGLIKNSTTTIAIPIPYSSEIEGLHVARAIIDSNQEVNDANRSNNEATRSFVVGAAANLHFDDFTASNETPEVGETINIEAQIVNNGELDVDADVLFSYVSAVGDTIPIGTKPVSVNIENNPLNPLTSGITQNALNGSNQTISLPWTVAESPVKIVGEIINSSELEFDYTDNFASTQLNNFKVTLDATLACEGLNLGTLTVLATNGTAPYTYSWSNGSMGEVLEAQSGTYGVIVVDATGKEAVAVGTIEEDPDCAASQCSLSAVDFNVPTNCDPVTNMYSTTVVVAYENEPTQGSITVNGIDYPITGSPQSFDVDFESGAVTYNVSFTEDTACSLMIATGVTLVECGLEGYNYLNDTDTWTPGNPNTDVNFTPSDNITVLEGTASFTEAIEVNNITVNNGATLNVENVLTINGDITNNGDMVFKSTATQNGELAAVPVTSSISGEFTVERYMSSHRAYRFVSSPVTTSTSIHANWQEGATSATDNPNPGYGTHITGTTADQQDGFDATATGNSSLYTLDATNQVFVAATNTNVQTITAGEGHLIFVRGDRSIDLSSNTSVGETRLRTRGALHTGDMTQTNNLTNVENEFNLIANPYPSAIDINQVIANSQNLNPNYYYVYDPTLGANGAYVTVDLSTGGNSSGSEANQYVQSGQAVQIATDSNETTSVSFSEADKVPGEHTSTFRAENLMVNNAHIIGQLYTTENYVAGNKLHDSFALLFSSEYDNVQNNKDAIKAFNFTENLGIGILDEVYSIERREMPVDEEQIDLFANNYQHQDYMLVIETANLGETTAYFVDSFTEEEVALVEGENLINFSIDQDAEASKATDRFYIRFNEQALITDSSSLDHSLQLFPNPTNTKNGFFLSSSLWKDQQVSINIRDLLGREVYSTQEVFTNGKIHVKPGNSLGNGTYFVEVKQGDQRIIKRFIIK
ncbi:CARDB domain-containing protein [Mesonia ostreae]|uniref:CARDB domain-containing protein n=1 Tax=Mesonia ostreae TaxID=861110 RepID=A0ABU2KHE3_9FLAO|nr:CARDB domain-containing protein [Mesonia ostreae]MDT0294109.1 CARDB domain-containing protein [Mesonia ostreae]